MFPCPCCLRLCFSYSPDEIQRREESRKIEKQIKQDAPKFRRIVRLLLLGAGESGKSTFLKQMKIIHGFKFDPAAIREYHGIIYQNVIQGMKVLVDARNKLGIPWEFPENQVQADVLMLFKGPASSMDEDTFLFYAACVQVLWKDGGIKTAFARRREFQLVDSVKYFFDNLDRIARPGYTLENQDILHARKATKGIIEFVLHVRQVPFHFIDVGGQRSQRQKWLVCFENVTSILFMVSSSEYDQTLVEDRTVNRFRESCSIFSTIINHEFFRTTSVILFLNKTDLLLEKVTKKQANIQDYFPEFKGDPWSVSDVQNFQLRALLTSSRFPERRIFYHFTTAVDTENIKVVFTAVKDTILGKNLEDLMLQ
ncbi:unnamed protein product [Notodromas monacha]|uniref:Guanine nucleotide-binding protein subunit alpha-12 n=1 Tax=Notodromas monacha TaxID=399045 RepID=A0A7R9GGA5_9CRUS|nr:unnamed protein product [Notodromas monacha]CAG0921632.1 unnamed protein product [Notodromas monacha]